MKKQVNILTIFILICLIIVLYIILNSELITVAPDNENDDNNSQIVKKNALTENLKNNYKEDVSQLLTRYSMLVDPVNNDKEEITITQIEEIKNKLLELRVPTEFKNLHLNLVLALTKLENYLQAGNEQDKIISQQLISQAKANYGWLNK